VLVFDVRSLPLYQAEEKVITIPMDEREKAGIDYLKNEWMLRLHELDRVNQQLDEDEETRKRMDIRIDHNCKRRGEIQADMAAIADQVMKAEAKS